MHVLGLDPTIQGTVQGLFGHEAFIVSYNTIWVRVRVRVRTKPSSSPTILSGSKDVWQSGISSRVRSSKPGMSVRKAFGMPPCHQMVEVRLKSWYTWIQSI